MRHGLLSGKLFWAVGVMLLLPVAASAGYIATGANSNVDGYLDMGPDEYGSWCSATFGGLGDHFNPAGAHTLQEAAFTSGFFLFAGGNQRELLSGITDWQNVFAPDATLSRSVIMPNAFSDSSGNGVIDTATSAFRVFGGATDLAFDLTQRVDTFAAGVAFLRQDYAVTNNAATPISFWMVRAFDGDLLWDGGYDNDEVGTSMHGAGLGPYIFEQEASAPSVTAVTVSSLAGGDYYGGKHGITPPNGPPMYAYGTDTQVWDAYGVPASWANHVAGVGYNTNGVSGTQPPGSTSPYDGFVGLGFQIDDLAVGETRMITVFHTYGQNTPVPEPTSLVLLALGALGLRRRRR